MNRATTSTSATLRTRLLTGALSALAVLALAGTGWAADLDGDGLSDSFEAAVGTNPAVADSDGDNLLDGTELFETGTDPWLADTDGDSVNDDVDTEPLLLPTGPHDGGTAVTGTGWPTGTPYAPSGESARDGKDVYVHSGRMVFPIAVTGVCAQGIPWNFTILHDTMSAASGVAGDGNFCILDTQYTVDGTSGDVTVLMEDGVFRTWTWDSVNSVFDPPAGILDTLDETSPGSGDFDRTTIRGVVFHYASGGLDSIEDCHGNKLDFTSNGSGQVTSVTDARTEQHTFSYYAGTGRLEKMTMADGSVWTFLYNVNGQLHRIEGPNSTSFPTGIDREFRYVNGASGAPALNGNMTQAIDGKGTAWMQVTYDTSDRVDEQTVNAGTFEFDYSAAASYKTTVTDREGNERVWEWDSAKLTRKKLEQKSNRNVRASDPVSWDTSWTHDAGGYLLSVTRPAGNGVKYTLNAAKLPTERRHKEDMSADDDDDDDIVHEWTYDSSKQYGVTKYTDPEGNETTYTLNACGQTLTTTFPDSTHVSPAQSITHTSTYNTDGSVATFTDGEGVVTKYEYFTANGANKGRVKKRIVDEGTGKLNLTTEYDYAPCGMVKKVTDPEGNVTEHTTECYGIVTKTTGPVALGYVTEYAYDHNLNRTSKKVKNVDENGTAVTTPVAWWLTEYAYDGFDRIHTVTEWLDATGSRVTQFAHNANDLEESRTVGTLTVNRTYDERDLLFETVGDPGTGNIEATTTYDYDDNGNVESVTDPLGNKTTHEYDGFDRRDKTIDALDDYSTVAYDKNGNVTETKRFEEAGTTDVLMAHGKRRYDELNRFWKSEAALIDTTTTWYSRTRELDKRGLVTKSTNRLGKSTTTTWDNARRRLTTTDPLGNKVELTYDDNGNVTEIEETEKIPGSTGTEVYVTELEYDEINRRVKRTVIDRNDSTNKKVTEWKLNSRSLVAKTIDPMGWSTENVHDGRGRLLTQTRNMASGSIVTTREYDALDNVTVLEDDNGNETLYDYDDLGRLVEKTYEDLTTVEYVLDDAGNVLTRTDQNGTEVDFDHDALNRVITVEATLATGVGGDTDESYEFDALGRMTKATDDDSTVEWTYDSLGRALTEKQGDNPFGTSAKTVTRTFDAEGRATQIDYPSGFESHRTFDDVHRLTAIEDKSSVSIADLDLHGGGGRRKQVSFGNSTTASYTYDGFRRPTDIVHEDSSSTELAGFEYGWDKNDNPTYEERSHQSDQGDVYAYDRANRLVTVLQDVDDPANEVSNPGAEVYVDKVGYTLDDVLNFSQIAVTPYGGSASTTSFTSNGVNEYTAIGGTSRTFDANGNLTDDGTNTYQYDFRNHLIKVTRKSDSVVIAEYAYDAVGLGRRIESTVGSDTTRFVYSGQQCLEEYDGSGDLLRLFVFGQGLDEVLMMEAPDVADVDADSDTTELKRFYYHVQLIGSVTHVTDPDENVVESYDYGPYGEIEVFDQSGSTVSGSQIGNPFTYTGRRLDEETGLYYYRARHYDPVAKRFIQRDPLEYVDGPNARGYVGGAPVARFDPLGLDFVDALIDEVKELGRGLCQFTLRCPAGYTRGNSRYTINTPCDDPPRLKCFRYRADPWAPPGWLPYGVVLAALLRSIKPVAAPPCGPCPIGGRYAFLHRMDPLWN